MGAARRGAALRDAVAAVPRHLFVPPAWRDMAYVNRPLPIGRGLVHDCGAFRAAGARSLKAESTRGTAAPGPGSPSRTPAARAAGRQAALLDPPGATRARRGRFL